MLKLFFPLLTLVLPAYTETVTNTLVMKGFELCDSRGDPCGNITEATFSLVTHRQTCTHPVAPLHYNPPDFVNMEEAFTIASFSKYRDSLMACHTPFAYVDVPVFITDDSQCFIYDRVRREWYEVPVMVNIQHYLKQ